MKKQAIAFLLALALLGGCAAAPVEPGSEPEASAPASTDASSGTSSEAPSQEAAPPVEPQKPEPEPPEPLSPFPLGEELIIQTVPSIWKLPETERDASFAVSNYELLGAPTGHYLDRYNRITVVELDEITEVSDDPAYQPGNNRSILVENTVTGKTIVEEYKFTGGEKLRWKVSVDGKTILYLPETSSYSLPRSGFSWVSETQILLHYYQSYALFDTATGKMRYLSYPVWHVPRLLAGNAIDWERDAPAGPVLGYDPASGGYLLSVSGEYANPDESGKQVCDRTIYYCNFKTGRQFEVFSSQLEATYSEFDEATFTYVLFDGPDDVYFLVYNGGNLNFLGEEYTHGLYHVAIPAQRVTELALLERARGLVGPRYLVVSTYRGEEPGNERFQLVDLTTRTVVFERDGAVVHDTDESILTYSDEEYYYILDLDTMTSYAYSLRTLRQRFPGREIGFNHGVYVLAPKTEGGG